MANDERLEWEKLPTEELVAELEYTGLQLPPGLIDEIVRRGAEALPYLGRLVTDARRWESEDDDRWAPIFALHLLGAIGDPAAAPYIVEALRLDPDPDEIVENTPTVIAHLGPEAIPEFARFLLDERAYGLMRAVAADGLAAIAVLHPQTRPAVLGFLRRFVEEAPKRDPEAVTGVILSLTELRDREAMPAIVQAFRAGRVDQDLMTIEDVHDGMRSPETISRDWHYTGDPLAFFSEERLEALRKKQRNGRPDRGVPGTP